MLAIDPQTGHPIAVIEGTTITAIRTAAAATDVLSRADSKTLAIIGAGVQAREHLTAIHCVRGIEQTFVAARNRTQCERLVEDMAKVDPPIGDISICETADEDEARAEIVCTVTTSADPVFSPGVIYITENEH